MTGHRTTVHHASDNALRLTARTRISLSQIPILNRRSGQRQPELGTAAASLNFWVTLCGFEILYDRPKEGFAYLRSGNAFRPLAGRCSWLPKTSGTKRVTLGPEGPSSSSRTPTGISFDSLHG